MTAATAWTLSQLPPTSQAILVPGVHFTWFVPWMYPAAQTAHTASCIHAAGTCGSSPVGCGLRYKDGERSTEPSATHTWTKVALGAPCARQQQHPW